MDDRFAGMKETKEFAEKLFDALARRRNLTATSISKAELKEFWDQTVLGNLPSEVSTMARRHLPTASFLSHHL